MRHKFHYRTFTMHEYRYSRQSSRLQLKDRVFTEMHRQRLSIAVSKFTPEQVEGIRARLRNGERVVDIAKELDVHRTTISKIKKDTYFNHACHHLRKAVQQVERENERGLFA